MDKSRMTFTFRQSHKEPARGARDLRERRPFEYYRRADGRTYARHAGRNGDSGKNSPFLRLFWLMPAILATITGMVLGLGVLFVFKNATPESKPITKTIAPTSPGTAPVSPTLQTLPGLDLVAYQVGAFKDQEAAKKEAANLEKSGLQPVVRNSDMVQLFVGVAVDKTQGQPVADALAQAKVRYYVKEYKVEQRKGVMQGITAKDAAVVSGALTQTAQVLKDGIPLATAKSPQKEALDAWSKRVQALGTQLETARQVLEKAGKRGEIIRLDDILEQLNAASVNLQQGGRLLEVLRPLVQSIVNYEELTSKLVQP
ncbi:hypothetical protein [Effusibacillus lacus]|uniref:SPOR domain-containing protein n=1 Tax=Effusibacillus lacus TaxID=1348429 RepID=A0A292YQ06_9BACL|nr:hypothetical protein [Effusibacillus lacus]TCS76490.1 hypothetical protein EDD64_10234 [Effusibacillus lacus]GAX90484.1 hypothetical protein EFBL_2111 [Effusibacillus lacus]